MPATNVKSVPLSLWQRTLLDLKQHSRSIQDQFEDCNWEGAAVTCKLILPLPASVIRMLASVDSRLRTVWLD